MKKEKQTNYIIYEIIANNRGIDKEKPNIKKMCHNSKVPQS